MKKRLISFLLVAIMVFTMMPVKAEAEGAPTNWGKLNSALQGGTQSTVENVFEVDDSVQGVRKIKLLSDITAVSGDTTLIVDKQIILDLNGFTINGKIDDSTSVGSVIKILSGATLTLKDDSTGKTGRITGGNNADTGGGGVLLEYNGNTSTGSTLNMYGGTICGNNAKSLGGGVYVRNYCVFNMYGGAISDNTSSTGGGVSLASATFTMYGGIISGNKASGNAGGVSISNSIFIMNGGTISGNNANISGGVHFMNGSFTMTGGEISGNVATTNGGGVTVNGTPTIGGTAKITGNTVNDASNNVYLVKNKSFDINTPSSGMSIGVTMQTPGVFTSNSADGYLSYFSSDDSTYKVVYDTDKKLKLAKQYNVTIDASITNGTVTTDAADGKAFEGDTVTVTATPSSGYILNRLKYNDGTEDYDITTTKSFTMPSTNVTITAEFEEIPSEIKVTASSDKSVYDEGELITLTATVMDGNTPVDKEFVVFSVNGMKIAVQTDNGSCSISKGLPAGTYTISACYEKDGDEYKDEVEVTVMKQPNENYIVKFDLNNGNTNGPEMQTIEEGKKATKPENPTYEGFVFAEWYTDKDCTDGNEYDFDSEVREDFVLYAKWISNLPDTYLVVFDTNGHDEIDAQEIKHGEKATKPANPSDEGWIFEGWYSDAELTKEYDFSAPIMADIKLFAKWTEEGLPTPPEPEPKPVEVYYAPLVADLKANEEGVIEWEAGDSLPLEAVKLLVDKPELSLEFSFTYEGEEHTIFIPAGAFEKYYDVTIPWYGPAWLIQYFEKSEKEVIEYTIVSGDTLNALAEKFKCTVEEILALNPYISDKHWIYPNNKLLIPVQK